MIASAQLQDFRTYKNDSFEFSPGVSIIVGPNASGKTNLLEAILVLCQGGSYRARDIDLVAYGQPWARLEGQFDEEVRSVTIERRDDQTSQKKFSVNKQKYSRLSASKKKQVVIFEPEHLQLLQAGPDKRRDFLDDILERTEIGFTKTRRDYQRALAQRNRLLKRVPAPTASELFAWDVRLSELGSVIAKTRAALVDRFNIEIEDLYKEISSTKHSLQLSYETPLILENYNTQLLHKLETSLAQDLKRGFTSNGPHREDFTALLNMHDARLTASRGEVRTILLSLKLLEIDMVERSTNEKPILLLDDVFSELDGARRKALTKYLKGYQTFITTTDADVVLHHFIDECTIIPTEKS